MTVYNNILKIFWSELVYIFLFQLASVDWSISFLKIICTYSRFTQMKKINIC